MDRRPRVSRRALRGASIVRSARCWLLALTMAAVQLSGCIDGDGVRVRFGGGDDAGERRDAAGGIDDATATDRDAVGREDAEPAEDTPMLGDVREQRDATPDGGTAEDAERETSSSRSDAVCASWLAARADMSEGRWSGDVSACDPGDMDAAWRDRALRLLNAYRFIADLPPVTANATYDREAQACALIMHAAGSLSHTPPEDWRCWSEEASRSAGASNIASAAAMLSMDMWMVDFGNDTTLGHRRWILSDWIGEVGIGSTDSAACLDVIQGFVGGSADWRAYPSPGPFPIEAIDPITAFSADDVDEVGWSIQSDTRDLATASVTITRDGEELPVDVSALQPSFGSESAIAVRPRGWTSEVGATYRVEVAGAGSTFSYEVEMVDCDRR